MKDSVDPKNFTRRELMQGGLVAGALAFLAGCQSAGRNAALPGPVWPDKEPRPTTATRLPDAPVQKQPSGPVAGVIARSRWTSAQPKWALSRPMNGVRRITVHHDAIISTGLTNQADVARRLDGIRKSHLSRGSEWVDIGYHYIIDPAGRVWAGRPISIEGAHVRETNEHNLGIMLMGNFDEQRPTSAQLSTLDAFVADQMRRYRVPLRQIYTHQELRSTACPGRNLQRYMLATRATSGRMATA